MSFRSFLTLFSIATSSVVPTQPHPALRGIENGDKRPLTLPILYSLFRIPPRAPSQNQLNSVAPTVRLPAVIPIVAWPGSRHSKVGLLEWIRSPVSPVIPFSVSATAFPDGG